jgi:hypothetical protein
MTWVATRMEIPIDCQKEKKRIPFTQRNFGTGQWKRFNNGKEGVYVHSPEGL